MAGPRRTRHSPHDRRNAQRVAGADPVFRKTTNTPLTILTRCVAFFRFLVNADRVLKQFRTGFLGKASPVHFFWGGFDLSRWTRFSGRRAPASSRRHTASHRCRDVRGLFSRSEQRRILARQRRDRLPPRSILTPIPNRRASAPRKCVLMRPSSARRRANTFCLTRPCASRPSRTRRCSSSCKAPMRQPPMPQNGTAKPWNAYRVTGRGAADLDFFDDRSPNLAVVREVWSRLCGASQRSAAPRPGHETDFTAA